MAPGIDRLVLASSGMQEFRVAAAEASLFLLVGGLVMLTIVFVLVFIQNLVPDKTPVGSAATGHRRLRALDGGPLAQDLARRGGRNRRLAANAPGRPAAVAPLDLAMDRLVELRLGEPRLLQAQVRTNRIRLYGCRGCAYGSTSAGPHADGCARERAALEEVFAAVYGGRVRTVESACRRRGDAACEFEVVH